MDASLAGQPVAILLLPGDKQFLLRLIYRGEIIHTRVNAIFGENPLLHPDLALATGSLLATYPLYFYAQLL